MARELISRVLAGREAELTVLADAFAAASGGTPATVLLGSEAGGGKSRLIREFTARVRDRAMVLAGGCVELSAAGLPYAPFAAALRELARQRGTAEVAALLPGRSASELAWLLPEFGTPPSGADPETARARLFEVLLALLEALAEQQPAVLIVEDVHWADRLTCDLLGFLVRNVRDASVLLIATFRSEDPGHRQPLRSLLANLARMEGVTRLELPRLSREQVARQLEGILGGPPPPSVTAAVHERGGGNPLFTEALLNSDGTVSRDLPLSLRELLLSAVTDLPEQTQQLLRTAAAGGNEVSHALLAAVTGSSDASLTAAVRPAVAASILVSGTDSYAFRHELIREAVLADTLPGERVEAHRRFAETLVAAPALGTRGVTPVQVARHWLGARDTGRALTAAWQAAASAGASCAYAEQLAMLEQVLDLLEQVPGPARPAGADRLSALELAADAARWAGEPERGLALVETALAVLGGTGDPLRRAALLLRRAGLLQDLLLPGQLGDLRAALALADGPSPVRARVLGQLCWALKRENHLGDAELMAGELRDLASRLGDAEHQAEAQLALAALAALRGEDTVAGIRGARDAAVRAQAGRLEAWAYLTLTDVLERRGDHDRAIAAGRDGLARARQLGLARQIAAPIAGNLAESLTSAGRWDEATEILAEILSLDLPALGRNGPLLVRGLIAVARGERETTARTLAELRSQPAGVQAEVQRALSLAQLDMSCLLAAGDLAGALAAATAVPDCDLAADPRYSWPLLTTAMRACADAGDPAPRQDPGGRARLREALAQRAALLARRSPVQDAQAAMFAAETLRARGTPDPRLWDDAAAAWEALGQPYPLAYTLLRGAGAAMAQGSRDTAASRLQQAAGLAARLAARPLAQQISQLASRARITLGSPGSHPAAGTAPMGLTARELEVLRLAAAGRSNREIAADLFISPRTASVHVSNILAKLHVASRGEAAAAAYRLHLFDPP